MSSWKKNEANFIWHAFDGLHESVNAFVANLTATPFKQRYSGWAMKATHFQSPPREREREREPGGIWTPAAQVLQRGLGGRVSVQPGGPESQPRLQGTGFVCGERGEESVTAFLSSISTDVLWCSYIMRGGRGESWHSLFPQGMKYASRMLVNKMIIALKLLLSFWESLYY